MFYPYEQRLRYFNAVIYGLNPFWFKLGNCSIYLRHFRHFYSNKKTFVRLKLFHFFKTSLKNINFILHF